jgi:hypothetical protein
MYYKDKRHKFNMVQHLLNSYMIKLRSIKRSSLRQFTALICSLIILVYLYKLITWGMRPRIGDDLMYVEKDDGIIEISRKSSSIIIDALMAKQSESDNVYSLVTEYINGIFFYNMNEPIEAWWPFECVETKMKQSINTKLCIHDPKFDKVISAQIKENGLWEPTNVRSFLRQLNEVPEAHVMDIGANIGLYTLLAAKMNRSVIAVEPLHDNLNRMHKAAHLESVQSRVFALVNAVSNERKQTKVLLTTYFMDQLNIIRIEQ